MHEIDLAGVDGTKNEKVQSDLVCAYREFRRSPPEFVNANPNSNRAPTPTFIHSQLPH